MGKMVTMNMLDKKPSNAMHLSLEQAAVQKNLTETDDQIKTRLRERFDILDEMTRAVKKGDVRAMIVTGPPGCGQELWCGDCAGQARCVCHCSTEREA